MIMIRSRMAYPQNYSLTANIYIEGQHKVMKKYVSYKINFNMSHLPSLQAQTAHEQPMPMKQMTFQLLNIFELPFSL